MMFVVHGYTAGKVAELGFEPRGLCPQPPHYSASCMTMEETY